MNISIFIAHWTVFDCSGFKFHLCFGKTFTQKMAVTIFLSLEAVMKISTINQTVCSLNNTGLVCR